MKKIACLFLALITLSFSACSSDSSSDGNQTDDLYLKFTYNGQQYDFEPETITSLQKLIAGDQEVNSVFTRLSLWMPVTPTVGSHPVTDDTPTDANIGTLHNAELWVGDNTYTGTSGTIVITELDAEYVKGTFTFTGTTDTGATVSITNGSFRANR